MTADEKTQHLERWSIAIGRRITEEAAELVNFEPQVAIDFESGDMLMQLRARLAVGHVEKLTYEVPITWWDHLKRDVLHWKWTAHPITFQSGAAYPTLKWKGEEHRAAGLGRFLEEPELEYGNGR